MSPWIGNTTAWRILSEMLERGTVPHAILFVGPASVGKRTVMAQLVHALLGTIPVVSEDPFASLATHPDVTILARPTEEKSGKVKKNISIEQVREVRHRLQHSAFLGGWKVCLVEDAGALSNDAANAFLKTLEEPTEKTVVLLRTTSLGNVPQTVRSRCAIVRLSLVPDRDIRTALIARGVAHDRLDAAVGFAAGRPGRAVQFFQKKERGETQEQIVVAFASACGAPLWRRLLAAEGAVPPKDTEDMPSALHQQLHIWESVLRDALLLAYGHPELTRHPQARALLSAWASQRTSAHILRALTAVRRGQQAIGENVAPRTILEQTLLQVG